MKRLFRLLCTGALMASAAGAQQVSIVVGERGRGSYDRREGRRGREPRRGPQSYGPILPLLMDGYYFDDAYPKEPAPAPAPVIQLVAPRPAPEATPPAPPPAPEVKEYNWDGAPPPARKAPRYFVLAMTDGTRAEAQACWVDGDVLNYMDARGVRREAPLDRVDRALSAKLNRERGLDLSLP